MLALVSALRVRRRWWKAALVVGLATTGMAPATAQLTVGPPYLTGRWSNPFEEGGQATPTCVEDHGRVVCKPVAQAMGMLPDGRTLYFDGFAGQENEARPLVDRAPSMQDSHSRVLDLRSGTPTWAVPANPTGGTSHPSAGPGEPADPASSASGTAGVPGRAGDGLVGSAAAAAGLPPTSASAPYDADENDGDMFAADVASLSDGRLLVAGGADWYNDPGLGTLPAAVGNPGVPEAAGLRTTRLFDPATNTFTHAGPMHFPRWLPGLVTLSDGRVLVAGGAARHVKNTQASNVRRAEIFDPGTGRWSDPATGSASEASLPLSPRLHLMLNGKVLYTAAGQAWAPYGVAADEAMYSMLQFHDPARGRWDLVGPSTFGMRDGAGSVLLPLNPPYQRASVLTFGGTLGPPPGGEVGTLLSTEILVDRLGVVKERPTRNRMLQGRWNPSGVTLPDGTVLAIGGASLSDTTAPGTGLAVRTSELYDPRDEVWREMARTNRDRTYGHSAVLLPDGRVLFGGHTPVADPLGPGRELGGPFPNNDRDPSFEIFTPHYLFRGPRPTIRHVEAGIAWGQRFEIQTHQAMSIEGVVLSRLPSPQHGVDSDARTIRLDFTRRSNAIEAHAPPHGAVAPPGYYYLFIMKETGRGAVPSMARIIHVGDSVSTAEALQPFRDEKSRPENEGSARADENTGPAAPIEKKLSELAGIEASRPSQRRTGRPNQPPGTGGLPPAPTVLAALRRPLPIATS